MVAALALLNKLLALPYCKEQRKLFLSPKPCIGKSFDLSPKTVCREFATFNKDDLRQVLQQRYLCKGDRCGFVAY